MPAYRTSFHAASRFVFPPAAPLGYNYRMKYSLRSLMIVAAVGPAMLAGGFFILRGLDGQEDTGPIILGVVYFLLFVFVVVLHKP